MAGDGQICLAVWDIYVYDGGMSAHPDLLAEVVHELERREGQLTTIAREVGMPYDTVLRIKRQENDPGYSKVAALHRYLFPADSDPETQGAAGAAEPEPRAA